MKIPYELGESYVRKPNVKEKSFIAVKTGKGPQRFVRIMFEDVEHVCLLSEPGYGGKERVKVLVSLKKYSNYKTKWFVYYINKDVFRLTFSKKA